MQERIEYKLLKSGYLKGIVNCGCNNTVSSSPLQPKMSPLFSFVFPSDIGKDKDTYTDDSEHGNYDARTDQSLLIQNKLTRQKTEPRTKSSLKVTDTQLS